jgi:predicted naringenin-chalcone synthase
VHVSTGYNRVEGNRRASRNDLVGASARVTIRSFFISSPDCPAFVQLLGYESYMIPSTLDTLYLEWDESTSKFSFFLTSDVPYAIGEHMPLMINALLKRYGLSKKDIAHWVVHSGGKKVRGRAQQPLTPRACRTPTRNTRTSRSRHVKR